MATYTQACSQVGSFSYAKYFTLYIALTDRDGSSSTNKSKVDYNVYCQSSGSGSLSGANHDLYFKLGDSTIVDTNKAITVSSPNANIPIASGTLEVTHDSDGSKSISFEASIKATGGYGVSASKSGTFTLTKIPRYASLAHSLNSKTVNSIKINWSSDSTCDQVQYKIGSGSWVTASSSSAKSGTYIINSLSPNTSYSIYTRVRRSDSQLYTESSALSVTTYDIAKISSVGNFEHGSNASVSITNPASIASLSLVMKIGSTQILSRTVKAGTNTIVFSDTELDNIYKKYGSSNSLTATFTLSGSGYTNSKNATITLKGNQKTIKVKVSNNWKRGKVFIKISNTWKKAIVWENINGVWKRGI